MTAAEREHAKVGFGRVRAILHADWDPIGCGVPLDEYDTYAWPVLAMLQRRADRAELETYLRWVADSAMSSPVPQSRLIEVVDKLMALDLTLENSPGRSRRSKG